LSTKQQSSILTPTQTRKRVWLVETLDAQNNKVYEPKELTNDDLIDAIKQIMYEGKATKITVTLK
jgi:hypothetical protein